MCCGNGSGVCVCHSMRVKGRTELLRVGSLCSLCPRGSNSGPHIIDAFIVWKFCMCVCLCGTHVWGMHSYVLRTLEAKEDIRCSAPQLSLALELARLGCQRAAAVFPSLPLHSKSTPCFYIGSGDLNSDLYVWAARDLHCWAVSLTGCTL